MASLREENAKRAARRRFEARELIRKLKSGPCKDCNGRFHHCQMDFVHKGDGDGRPISRNLLRSKETIIAEVAECDLVCANCGRLRVWNRQRLQRAGPT